MKSNLPKWLRFYSQQLEAHCTLHHVHITLIQGLYCNHFLTFSSEERLAHHPPLPQAEVHNVWGLTALFLLERCGFSAQGQFSFSFHSTVTVWVLTC